MSDESTLKQETTTPTSSGGILDILGKLMSSGGAEAPPTTEKAQAEPNILSSLLSNPELLSKLPELISIISPLMGSLSSQGGTSIPASVQKPTLTAPATPALAHKSEQQNRSALLCALKPYLKKERQDAIDYMIKLSRLGDILKTL